MISFLLNSKFLYLASSRHNSICFFSYNTLILINAHELFNEIFFGDRFPTAQDRADYFNRQGKHGHTLYHIAVIQNHPHLIESL